LEQTARKWVGQSKQEIYLGKGTSKRLSSTLDLGHEGCICKVLQEDGCSSMDKVMIAYNYPHEEKIVVSVCNI
jgi:hypothetical protein